MIQRNETDIDWRGHIECDRAILCGKRTLRGTRLAVEFIRDLLAAGWTRDELLRNYPNLSEEGIRAAIEYADHARRDNRRGNP